MNPICNIAYAYYRWDLVLQPGGGGFLRKGKLKEQRFCPTVGADFLRKGMIKEQRFALRAGPISCSAKKWGKEGGSRGGPVAPLLRISPYPAGLRAARPVSGLFRQRRCNLSRTKAAADGGWIRLPPTFPPSSGISAALPMPYGGTGGNFVILWSLKSDCKGRLLFLL